MLMREEIKAAAEAVLFVRGETVGLDELVELLDIPLLDLKIVMDELILEYNKGHKGVQILILEGPAYLMCTHPACSDILSRMERPVRRRLSQASLETLAIIAYRQPVTRAEIEKIRGVKCDKVIASLMERGLIEEAGYKAVAGKPTQFITSDDFLKVFGLTSIKELPVLEEA